jgi:hypothetical protein
MTFPAEMFDLVLKRIATGESLRQICQSEGLPSRETFFGWIRDNPERRTQYLEACAMRSLVFVENALDVLEDLGNEPTSSQVNAARLKIDTIKWKVARLQPKVYGDRNADGDDVTRVTLRDFTGKQPYFPGDANEAGSTVKN